MNMETLAEKAARRSNLTLIILGAALILAVLAVAALSYRFLYNFVLGPFDVTRDELHSYSDAGQPLQYWVRVPALMRYDTGIQYFTTRNNTETVEHSYHALELGDKLLLASAPGDVNGSVDTELTVEGFLDTLTSPERYEVIGALVAENPDLEGEFLPYKLNGYPFRTANSHLLFVVVGVGLAILGLVLVILGLVRSSSPLKHPIFRKLARYGDPEQVSQQVEMEIQQPHDILNKNLHLLKNWLVYAPTGKFEAVRYDSLMWFYQHVQTQRYYGILVSRIRSVMLHDSAGGRTQAVFGRKEEPVIEALQAIQRQAPWSLIGFDNELERAWNKDRENFIAQVNQRKAQLQQT